MSELRLVEEELRFKFYYRGQFALAYNKGHLPFGDFHLSRPNFFPVYSPSGCAVTTSCAYRYNHHRSVFIGHAKVNGINFFHDNNPTRDDLGDIVLHSADGETSASRIVLRTKNGWIAKSGATVLHEERDIVWMPGGEVHVLDVSCRFLPVAGDVVFDQEKHSFFGFRVADTMDVEDGGRVVNSKGQENEVGAMGELADWVDYSGIVAGRTVGLTLMNHPSNPPSPFFVRDYGTILSNFTMNGAYLLRHGDALAQRFRILVHEGAADDVDFGRYHRNFCAG